MDGIQEAVGELIVALKSSSNRLLKLIEKSRNDLKCFLICKIGPFRVARAWRTSSFQIILKVRMLNKYNINVMKMEIVHGKKLQKIIS